MKSLKKLLSYIIALTMVLSLAAFTGVKVHAEDKTYTLTLGQNTKTKASPNGHTYYAYQIFSGTLSTDEKTLSDIHWGTGVDKGKTSTIVAALKDATKNTYKKDSSDSNTIFNDVKNADDAAGVAKALEGVADNSSMLDAFAQLIGANLSSEKTGSSVEDGKVVINGLKPGYYLVKEDETKKLEKTTTDSQGKIKAYDPFTDAYTKFIVKVVGNTSAEIKTDVPTVVKEVKDTNDSTGETSDWQDSADADFNDNVEYRLRGTMPANINEYKKYFYKFTDTMSKGLTYSATATKDNKTVNNYTIKVYPNGDDEENKSNVIDITDAKKADGTYYFVNNGAGTSVNTDGEYKDGKEFTWTCSDLKEISALKNDDGSSMLTAKSVVTVEYTAKLNENAAIGSAGNPNKVDLTYSNNPNVNGEGNKGTTPEDKNIVFTYKTVFDKVNENDEPLSGAEFTLNKWNGSEFVAIKKTEKTATVTENGTRFTFKGLDDGIYQLVESKTPAGYNTMKPLEFEITATHTNDGVEKPLTPLTLTELKMKKMSPLKDADQTLELKDNADSITGDIDAGSMTTKVVNKSGSTLPSTGGMGTTLLYVAGGILVACAAAYVVLNKKRA